MFKKKQYKVYGLLIKDDGRTKRCRTIVTARTSLGAKRKARKEFTKDLSFLLENNYTLVINKLPLRIEGKHES